MSLSSASLSSVSSCYGYSGTPTAPSPRKCTGGGPANTRADVVQQAQLAKDAWNRQLADRILQYKHSVDDFIDTVLPCSKPWRRNGSVHTAFAGYMPSSGKEVAGYPKLVSRFEKLVSGFSRSKRVNLFTTNRTVLPFPFKAFEIQHHPTSPDLSFTFPGKQARPASWQDISMVIEAKATDNQDPFPRGGQTCAGTVEQLAKNARSLLLAHGALAVFVIGIYGKTVRLARFDHSCAVISRPFLLKAKPKPDELSGEDLLQKFLWHFVHPLVGDTVVGCDPTLKMLSWPDRQWLNLQLSKSAYRDWAQNVADLYKARRVEVFDQETGRYVPCILYGMIEVNGRLFSRASTVWHAIEDTRIWVNGRLVPDPTRPTPAPQCIVKDSWGQLSRVAETEFYARLAAKIPPEEYFGIATMLCGGDIGAFELQWWHRTRAAQSAEGVPPAQPVASTSSASPLRPSISSDAPLFSSIGSKQHPPNHLEGKPGGWVPDGPFPLPFPQHQTYSWRLVFGEEYAFLERTHTRMMIKDIGRPLTQFESSRDVVQALRDSTFGHGLALRRAGVLHRDISIGNILLTAKDRDAPGHAGFMHDLDYSSFEDFDDGDDGIDDDPDGHSSTAGASTHAANEERRKERTGTFYFMAYEILSSEPTVHSGHHDLESIYWVLLWIVLRHTKHSHPLGQKACSVVFMVPDDSTYLAAAVKRLWLTDQVRPGNQRLVVTNNEPLTQLLSDLAMLVGKQLPHMWCTPGTPLTHEAMLEKFDAALAMDGWPEKDYVRCTLLENPKIPTNAAGQRRKNMLTKNPSHLLRSAPVTIQQSSYSTTVVSSSGDYSSTSLKRRADDDNDDSGYPAHGVLTPFGVVAGPRKRQRLDNSMGPPLLPSRLREEAVTSADEGAHSSFISRITGWLRRTPFGGLVPGSDEP
ncbi:hypothetical protein BD413DRAFT_483568 [Trametes elegans]|nr:hypothetical protein BD413DRAFT_483568 [Trametes elegans]